MHVLYCKWKLKTNEREQGQGKRECISERDADMPRWNTLAMLMLLMMMTFYTAGPFILISSLHSLTDLLKPSIYYSVVSALFPATLKLTEEWRSKKREEFLYFLLKLWLPLFFISLSPHLSTSFSKEEGKAILHFTT